MEQEGEKPFYESRVYWSDVLMLPILNAFIIGIPFISLVLLFDIKTTQPVEISVVVSYLILTVIGTFISAKFFIRKYVFYEDRVETVFIYRESGNRTIRYNEISEVFYISGRNSSLTGRMVVKLKEGKSKGLDIQEKYARTIMLELKKRNVQVDLKMRNIYNKFLKSK